MVVSMAGGALISRTGRYRALPIAGTILMAAGLALFATMDIDTTRTTTSLYMVVLGAGMGCLMQSTMLIAQNDAPLRNMGAATGAATFLRNMGGSVGVSLLGSVYATTLTDTVASHMGTATGAGAGDGRFKVAQMTPQALKSLPEKVQHVFQQAVTDGVGQVFAWGAAVAAAGLLVAVFIRHVPLRGFDSAAKPGTAPEDTAQDAPTAAVG